MSEIVKTCKTHGDLVESQCQVRNRRLADGSPVKRYECKQCCNERKKQWNKKNPSKQKDYKFKDWPSLIGDGPILCTTCKTQKEQAQFYKHNLKNKYPRCKECQNSMNSRYKKENPEQYLTVQRKHRAKNKKHYSEASHAQKLRVYYDMTPNDYQDMLDRQNGVCAICLNPETRKHSNGTLCRLSVDHCHEKGIVRGLLCNQCNLMLHRFADVALLERTIAYLKNAR
jgi:hypothetical protein